MSADRMQIGEVAERVGLSLRTIRFYEEAGLVIPTPVAAEIIAGRPPRISVRSRAGDFNASPTVTRSDVDGKAGRRATRLRSMARQART